MKLNICLTVLIICMLFACNNGSIGQHSFTNDLINESSPYLLQHAHNPVDWKAWNAKALEKAKAENKLVLVSIGYAACHWCHVMEEESFQDTAVANLMNRHFISIKVDREERPDVDDVYMTACQLVNENGCGWPLNAIALPDGKPVWAGTYFPKKQWTEILNYFIKEYENPDRLKAYAQQLTEGVQLSDSIAIIPTVESFSNHTLDSFSNSFLTAVDFKKGGLQGSLKFPMPGSFSYLLEYYHQNKEERVLEAVTTTLDEMRKGGIFDQLDGGFARYSTDPDWRVPHFEKMLYDNAQLIGLYANTYKITQAESYKETADFTFSYLNNTLLSPEGAYYASMNADSEGEEGKFYVWSKAEIDEIITDPQSNEIIRLHFNIKPAGNWENGKNVLYINKEIEKIAQKLDLDIETVKSKLKTSLTALSKARAKRIKPTIDDKILTSWNALLISGLVDAYEAFKEDNYLESARNIANFLEEKMMESDYRLNRNFKSGKASINAFLDDYAYTIAAFIQLYEITFEENYLNTADQLMQYVFNHFSKGEGPLFFYTSDLDPPLVARTTPMDDNVMPSANASMAQNLHKLGLLLYRNDYLERSKQLLSLLQADLANTAAPAYYYSWGSLLMNQINEPYEVVIMGEEALEKRRDLAAYYLPDAIFLGSKKESSLELTQYKYVEGKTRIYVCQNKACKLPVESVEEALKLMK